jgi:hypothetical protein
MVAVSRSKDFESEPEFNLSIRRIPLPRRGESATKFGLENGDSLI